MDIFSAAILTAIAALFLRIERRLTRLEVKLNCYYPEDKQK